jgi:ParB family chromosome partitioning protein
MSSTRKTLDAMSANLDESMGLRLIDLQPKLTPVPSAKDAGRRPLRQFGRVEIARVIPDPKQPRVDFTEDALDRLAQSIREKGQLSPIRVRWDEELQKWVIICGERRWRAAQRAGLPEIECSFHETDLSSSEILEQQLIENCLREDLQPVEEARAFAALMDLNGWTAKALAEAVRVSPSRISRALALLRLPGNLQEQVNTGAVSSRSAYELSRLDNPGARDALAVQVAAGSLTAADAARAVRQRQGKPKPPARGTRQTFVTQDGWKILITSARKGNYHEIQQALLEALDEVRHRIDCGHQLF